MNNRTREIDAIVVGMVNYREADRIVRLLSPQVGRVDARAPSARASRKRFGGIIDIGNRVELVLTTGRGGHPLIAEATLADPRMAARRDLARLSTLIYACELCGALARPEHPEPRLYGLLDVVGLLLDGMPAAPGPLLLPALEAKALTFAGWCPVLDRCAICEQPAGGSMALAPSEGGAVHLACAERSVGEPVTPEWLIALEQARRTSLMDLPDAPTPAGPDGGLAPLVEQVIGRQLRSRAVLAALTAPLQATAATAG